MAAQRKKKKSTQNLYGQEMGNKGAATRGKILSATAMLMKKRTLRDLKVSEIVTAAGVSSSTFYLYFQSVQQAALAVTEEINQSSPKVMEILNREWTRENVHANSLELLKAYFAFWDEHSAVLRLRNFAADEGDRDFYNSRRRSVEPIHFALQEKILQFQPTQDGVVGLHAPSTASVLLAMLERTAAVVQLPSVHKATRPRQIEAAAFLVASTMICVRDT